MIGGQWTWLALAWASATQKTCNGYFSKKGKEWTEVATVLQEFGSLFTLLWPEDSLSDPSDSTDAEYDSGS